MSNNYFAVDSTVRSLKEKIRNWRNKRFDLINLKKEKSADDSTLNFQKIVEKSMKSKPDENGEMPKTAFRIQFREK